MPSFVVCVAAFYVGRGHDPADQVSIIELKWCCKLSDYLTSRFILQVEGASAGACPRPTMVCATIALSLDNFRKTLYTILRSQKQSLRGAGRFRLRLGEIES